MIGLICPEDCPCESPPDPPCDSLVKVVVRGCFAVRLGGVTADVYAADGTTLIDSGATDGAGEASFSVPTPEAFVGSVKVAAFGGFSAASVGVLFNCVTRTVLIDLEADDDHVCVRCCSDGMPISKELDLSTGGGDLVLTHVPHEPAFGLSTYFRGEITLSVQRLEESTFDCCPPYDPFTAPCDVTDYDNSPRREYAEVSDDVTFKFTAVCCHFAGGPGPVWIVFYAIHYYARCGSATCAGCVGPAVWGAGSEGEGGDPGSYGHQTGDDISAYGAGLNLTGIGFTHTGAVVLSGTCGSGDLAVAAEMGEAPGLYIEEALVEWVGCCRDPEDEPDVSTYEVDPSNPFGGAMALSST